MPVAKIWPQVLRWVNECKLVTTEGIAVRLVPLRPGQIWPENAVMRRAERILEGMRVAGYVRRARPWSPGKLWAVAPAGFEALAEMKQRRCRVHKTDEVRRTKAKHRRDGLRAQRLCINGAAHGRATHGVLCRPCRKTHRGEA